MTAVLSYPNIFLPREFAQISSALFLEWDASTDQRPCSVVTVPEKLVPCPAPKCQPHLKHDVQASEMNSTWSLLTDSSEQQGHSDRDASGHGCPRQGTALLRKVRTWGLRSAYVAIMFQTKLVAPMVTHPACPSWMLSTLTLRCGWDTLPDEEPHTMAGH